MASRNNALFVCLIAFWAVQPAELLHAQTAGGTLLGTVRDSQGGVVPGAGAVVRNIDTGLSRALTTGQDGAWRAPNLQPGPYELMVQADGFRAVGKKGLMLTVGAEQVVDVELQIGSVSETVEVKGAAGAEVDLATSTVSHNVGGTTIRELPLNGRDWTQLATLQPGISSIGSGGGAGRGGSGVKLTVSGARPSENNFRLDGISLNDSSNSTPGSVRGTNLGVEAVREFSVVSNNYSAEYGRATGGVVNAITRSGTNDVKGTLFYFHRNSAMDTRNFFDRAARPAFRRHQYGAAIGGPLRKNRTFWFANFESVREFLATTSIVNTISGGAREGRLSTGNITVDPAAARLFPLLPLPNGPLLGRGDTGQFISQIPRLSDGIYTLGKLDHRFSDSASLSGSYFLEDAQAEAPDAYATKLTADRSRRQSAMIEYTQVMSPTVLNVARIAVARSSVDGGLVTRSLNSLLDDESLGFLPGYTLGTVTVTGITVPGNGPRAQNVNETRFTSWQAQENLFVTKGAHALKLGFSAERMWYNLDQPNRIGGEYTFGSVADFLANRPATFAALFPGSDTRRGLRQTLLAGYFQDDFRWKPNLTLNLGLRYEFLTIPSEVNGKVAVLRNMTDAQPRVGGPVLDRNPTTRNFSPRVGIVWDPFKDGKTSIRAGGGLFDSLPLLWLFDTPLTRSTPIFRQGVTANPGPGSFPRQAYQRLAENSLRTTYIDPMPPRAYSLKWNLHIQRQVRGWVAEAGYAASRGVHLPLIERNLNTVLPVNTGSGWIVPRGAQVLNPNFASINTSSHWNADSSYHGLQTSARKQWGDSMLINFSYAWSKSLDTASSSGSTNAISTYAGAVAAVNPLFPGLNFGLSDFDIRHNLALSMVWQTPKLTSAPRPLRVAVQGWQVGSILRLLTGTPFSVSLNNDQLGNRADTNGAAIGQRPNLVASPGCSSLTNPGNPNRYVKLECFSFPAPGVLGNVGRNTLTGPGLTNLDVSLVRNVKLTERVNSQIRIEAFNTTNTSNFATPNIVIYDRQGLNTPNAGLITNTATEARRIQLALKIQF